MRIAAAVRFSFGLNAPVFWTETLKMLFLP